jgi:hypothetical protein
MLAAVMNDDDLSFKLRILKYWGIPTICIGLLLAITGMPDDEVGPIAALLGGIVGIIWWCVAAKVKKPR